MNGEGNGGGGDDDDDDDQGGNETNTPQRHNPEYLDLNLHGPENLNSRKLT
jgi:hypothetical protein